MMKLTPRLLLAAPIAALALWSCGGGAPSPSTTTPPTGTDEGGRATDMHLHFNDINEIQLALISGNLVGARELGQKIKEGFRGEMPQGWAPFVERTIASAEMLRVSDDLAMATRIASTMANTCGDCHRAQNIVVIDHVAVAPPDEGDRFSNFMIQHKWSADRMWEGLIGPSDEAWKAGAAALTRVELTPDDVGEELDLTPEIEALLVQFKADASAAAAATTAEERQELYGSFLAGCASCHRDMMNQRD